MAYLYNEQIIEKPFHRSNVSLDAPCLRYLGDVKHFPNPRWAQHDNETIKRWIHQLAYYVHVIVDVVCAVSYSYFVSALV